MKKLLFILLITLATGCDENEPGCERIGAKCNDGTTSTATGSGACSHHGGVKEWICK